MDREKRYTVKKDFWGNDVFYDENGQEIGRPEKSIFGDTIVRDSSGNKVGTLTKDWYGRNVIEDDEFSIFTGHHKKTMVDDRELEDWELDFCLQEDDGGEY